MSGSDDASASADLRGKSDAVPSIFQAFLLFRPTINQGGDGLCEPSQKEGRQSRGGGG